MAPPGAVVAPAAGDGIPVPDGDRQAPSPTPVPDGETQVRAADARGGGHGEGRGGARGAARGAADSPLGEPHNTATVPGPQNTRDKLWDTVRRKRPLSLRSRLVGMLLLLLIAGFAVIGGVTHASMSARLSSDLQSNLQQALHRATSDTRGGLGGNVLLNFFDAQGQPPGTLAVLATNTEAVGAGGYVDSTTGKRVAVSKADLTKIQQVVSAIDTSQGPRYVDVRISMGQYRLIVQHLDANVSANNQIVAFNGNAAIGLSLSEAQRTLATLDLSMVLVSLGGIVLIGTLGTVLISRSLRPLARVSAVASAVAQQPLEKGDVDVDLRVAPADAVPGTEVGNVGAALNSLLDNVDGALEVRARSEARMRRFAADASHELRTPLAAIQGYSELIGATESLSDDGDRSLARVREQTRRMTELVENLLLLARLDEGRTPAAEPVDLTRLAADLSRDFTVAAKDHQWKLEFDAEHPVVVTGDEPQLNRVLQNLMSNARKHTSDGTTVTVGVRTTVDGQALLTVHDTGEGIDPEFVDKVFDRFARADAARSGSMPTTGLGLSIVKAILESHGGTITVRSVPGDTTFEVRLPLAAEAKPDVRA